MRRHSVRIAAAGVAAALLAAGPLAAHPHVFVDTSLRVHFDDEGRLAAVRVIWIYDEFTTLWLLDEGGLDPDFTGTLDAEEKAALARLDTSWVPGYEGDLYLWHRGAAVALSGPLEPWADLREGRAVTSHLRALPERIALAPGESVELRAYDPSFFTAYHLVLPVEVTGPAGCGAEVEAADLDAAYAELGDRLAEIPPHLVEADFPAVGHLFADRVVIRCNARN